MEFRIEELDIIRQWYDAVQELNPKYLEERDAALYIKIIEELSKIEERMNRLKQLGFVEDKFQRSFSKTITKGNYHYQQHISYDEIEKTKDFDKYIKRVLDTMEKELNDYIEKDNKAPGI
ncbi:MAG: hypothetical protein GX351_01415 [Peptococcaceae bacterium]|jgi:hypothetical protein|nr:hypothetical protein [Peptococcaceae bacterium]